MMKSDVPRAFAAHRKAAQQDPFVVNVEALLDGGDRLENIGFPRPVPSCAVDASEAIELDLSLVRDGRVSGRPWGQEVVDECRLGGVVLAAVKPDVEARGFGR